MNQNKIIFFCDYGSDVGLGHLFRTISIAESFNQIDSINILFLLEKRSFFPNEIEKFNYKIFEKLNDSLNFFSYFLELILEENPKILFIDSKKEIPRKLLFELKIRNIKIISIDDPSEKRLECDLVFYPPVESAYNLRWENFKGKYFIGWKWVALRKEFKNNKKPIQIKLKKLKKDILITMGGTDPYNLTKLIISKLDKKIYKKVNVKVLLGESYLFNDELESFILKEINNITIIKGTNNISELMRKVDIAICTFGMTAYELAALNVPSLHICLNDDHICSSELFAKKKMAYSLGDYKLLNSNLLNKYLINLVDNQSIMFEFKNNCLKNIDSHGSMRIAKEIKKLI